MDKTQRWKVMNLRLLLCLLVIVCLALMCIFGITDITPHQDQFSTFRTKPAEELLIDTEGCKIMYMDPFDKSVLKYLKEEPILVCAGGTPPLFDSNLTSLFLLESSLESYNITNRSRLSCCFTPFWRIEPKEYKKDNKVQYSKECHNVNESIDIFDEFIQVICKYDEKKIYEDYFSYVPLKVNRTVPNTTTKNSNKLSLNVLLFGLDSVSRLNFHRQMPQTYAYLKSISAVEMLGYNRVGHNTFQNLIPVLSGNNWQEIYKTCRKKYRFDNCLFVWRTYKEEGYITAFGEDATWMGIFNYLEYGFTRQPTDYMYGSFHNEMEEKIGLPVKSGYRCVGSRKTHKVFMDYITKFSTKMRISNEKYFGLFWGATLGHDYLNLPSIGDDDYKAFFETFKESGMLENTILFFMSDHGMRWGGIKQTFQGRMEEKLPFLFMLLPEWFKKSYPLHYRNLETNIRRLTTPFDVHETLKHLLNFHNSRNRSNRVERGYSLFTEISPNRTCQDAEIPKSDCTCQQSFEVVRNSTTIKHTAQALVDHMNSFLTEYAECATLVLFSILDCHLMSHGYEMLATNVAVKDFIVTIQTKPGDGIFESTVRQYISESGSYFKILGTVSRLNLHGNQSSCVSNLELKLYCYCQKLSS